MPVHPNRKIDHIGRHVVNQGPRTPVQASAGCDKYAKKATLNILQINIAGLQNKTVELEKRLHEEQIHIALLQETILPLKDISLPKGYTTYPCECQNCQGIMTLIRTDIQATVEHSPIEDIDIQEITVWFENEKFKIFNVYCSPSPSKVEFSLKEVIFSKTVVAGDFNAHTPSLGYANYNARGHNIEDFLNSSNLCLYQNLSTKPTLLHRRHGTSSRPDLTMTSSDITDRTNIEVLSDIGSDHAPIKIQITRHRPSKPKQGRKCLWNFGKAKWEKYKIETDQSFEKIPSGKSLEETYNEITSAILCSAKKTIPRGNSKRYKPYWTKDLEDAVQERRRLRKEVADAQQPSPELKTAYNRATGRVRYLSRISKRDRWRATCQNLDLSKHGKKAWRLLDNLSGSNKKTNPQPIKRNGNLTSCPKKKAGIFNKTFSKINRSSKKTRLDKALWKLFKQKQKKTKSTIAAFEHEFTETEFNAALKRLKRCKAPGADKIKNEMIINLGFRAKRILLDFINRTWTESSLPSAWRTAIINPVLKKGKTPGDPQNYRPISLTSCIGKLAERMVNYRLYWWLEKNGVLDHAQAGFRKGCRTEDQLFRLTQTVIDGFQAKKDTTAIFIDLQQAYDKIWRQGLLIKMDKLGICGKMLNWVRAFLTNRTIQTQFEGALSSKLTLEEGLPQGSALSCTLFLIYINDLPPLLNVSKALFADDLVIWVTEKYPIIARRKLKIALTTISSYCNLWKLKINEGKSVYTVFTRSTKPAKKVMALKLNDKELSKQENPVYLGVKLDTSLSMREFLKDLKKSAEQRLNLIKRLAGTNWGADKKTLRQLYLGYVRAKLDYCSPIQTVGNKTSLQEIDKIQNQGLRLVCGAMRSTPIAACEIDANINPLDIRRNQTLVEASERYLRAEPNHPNRQLVETWKPCQRLQQKSPLELASSLSEMHHLPTDRMQESRFSQTPPWEVNYIPEIKTSLLDNKIDKSTPQPILRTAAYETIDSYPSTSIQAFTDGSAFKATIFAGFGVFLKFPDNSSYCLSEPCGNICSNYTAEIRAMITAVEKVQETFEKEKTPEDLVIFTDSKSALQALESLQTTNKDIERLRAIIDSVHKKFQIKITLQWIPGHSGVNGNERADLLAKEGASKEQQNVPVDQSTVRKILQNNSKEEWNNRWARGTTGRSVFQEMSKPNKYDHINQLNRPEQCIIFRLRTGHGIFNAHLNRINPMHEPLCRNCPHPYETASHILFECPGLVKERKELLPPLPSPLNTLYCNKEQLIKTCKYYRLAMEHKE